MATAASGEETASAGGSAATGCCSVRPSDSTVFAVVVDVVDVVVFGSSDVTLTVVVDSLIQFNCLNN